VSAYSTTAAYSIFTASSFSEDFNNLHGIEKVVEKW
jgi:hypothetical protein